MSWATFLNCHSVTGDFWVTFEGENKLLQIVVLRILGALSSPPGFKID